LGNDANEQQHAVTMAWVQWRGRQLMYLPFIFCIADLFTSLMERVLSNNGVKALAIVITRLHN